MTITLELSAYDFLRAVGWRSSLGPVGWVCSSVLFRGGHPCSKERGPSESARRYPKATTCLCLKTLLLFACILLPRQLDLVFVFQRVPLLPFRIARSGICFKSAFKVCLGRPLSSVEVERRISCRVGQFIQEGQLRQRGGLVI